MAKADIRFMHLDEEGVTVDRNPMTGLLKSLARQRVEIAAAAVVLSEQARVIADEDADADNR